MRAQWSGDWPIIANPSPWKISIHKVPNINRPTYSCRVVLLTSYSGLWSISHLTSRLFLNISKVYESTWNTGLLCKLTQMWLPWELISVIVSFVTQILFRVNMDNSHLEWRSMLAGDLQGSILSPMLCNFYIPELTMYTDEICQCDKLKRRILTSLCAASTQLIWEVGQQLAY